MVAALLWDHDGVLVDTEGLYFRATREMLAEVDVPLSPEAYRQLLLVEGRGAWHLAAARGIEPAVIDRLRVRRDELYLSYLTAGNVLIDGAESLLESLQPHVRMAIVTSCKREHFEVIHRATKIPALVEFVLAREDYRESKPAPEPYRRAVERLGLPPDQCLVIEDSERGLRAATAAGLRCWIIETALSRGSCFEAAEQRFASLGELHSALLARCTG